MPPTDLFTRSPEDFCAHDSHNSNDNTTTTFMDAIARVGEDKDWLSFPHDMWGDIPLEREQLLGMVQRSVNNGNTKVFGYL